MARNIFAQIEYPAAVPMRYSKDLEKYLAERRSRAAPTSFCTGEWLRHLSDDAVHELVDIGECLLQGIEKPSHDPSSHADYIEVCVMAMAAELNRRKVAVGPAVFGALQVIAALEANVRAGLLTLSGPASLDPRAKPPQVTFTAKGIAKGLLGAARRFF